MKFLVELLGVLMKLLSQSLLILSFSLPKSTFEYDYETKLGFIRETYSMSAIDLFLKLPLIFTVEL